MLPLQDLLARIKWDADFGKGDFALGYYDRIADQENIVPFGAISLDPANSKMFSVQDEEGALRQIPLHRVRTVYKDGAVIWQRPNPPQR